MYHILLILYAGSISLLLGITGLAFLFQRKYGNRSFRYFSIYLAGAVLILLSDAVIAYDRTTADDLAAILAWISAAGAFWGSVLLAFALPRLSLSLVNRPASRLFRILDVAAVVPFGCVALIGRIGGFPVLDAAWDLLLIGFHLHCAWVLVGGRGKIEHPALRAFLKTVLWFSAIAAPLLLAQPFLRLAPILPAGFRDLPLPILLFFAGIASISLCFAMRHLFSLDIDYRIGAYDEVMRRFGISRRECEIFQLLVSGLETKEIAEQLFISVNTVKNHIHSIYQKTGVRSKVQLFNIIEKYHP